MLKVLALLGACTCSVFAGTAPTREVISQAEQASSGPIPAFYKGYVYWVGRDGGDNHVTIYEPEGALAHSFITDGGPVRGVAVDADGSIAVAWGQWDSAQGGGIDFRTKDGQFVKTIRTPGYLPAHIAIGEDHSLWVFGCDLGGGMALRRYGRDGNLLGTYLPRTMFPPELEPSGASWQSTAVMVARDRVGIWAVSGKLGIETEWVELDLHGNVLGRWRLDQLSTHVRPVLTSDGHVFVQDLHTFRVYTLDRAASTWQPLRDTPRELLNAADGTALVFTDADLGPLHVRWYEHP